MSTKTTAKKSNGTNSATSKDTKKLTANKSGKVIGVSIIDLAENADMPVAENIPEQPKGADATEPVTKVERKPKAKTERKDVAQKSTKPVTKKGVTAGKDLSIGGKKIRLATTCYHYYRHFLKHWLHSHGGGVASARFLKSPDSYDGHIIVLENDKTKGLKALEAWSKQNPDTKELFWDVKK